MLNRGFVSKRSEVRRKRLLLILTTKNAFDNVENTSKSNPFGITGIKSGKRRVKPDFLNLAVYIDTEFSGGGRVEDDVTQVAKILSDREKIVLQNSFINLQPLGVTEFGFVFDLTSLCIKHPLLLLTVE